MNRLYAALLAILTIANVSPLQASQSTHMHMTPRTLYGLVRLQYTVNGFGGTLRAWTGGCDPAASEDTVLSLLDGHMNQAGIRATLAHNDDVAPASGDYCSDITYVNNTASPKTVTLFGYTYNSNWVDVIFEVRVNGATQILSLNTWMAAAVEPDFYPQANIQTTYYSAPLPPTYGGGPDDTVLAVIDPQVGFSSAYDDDSGPQALASITATLSGTRKFVVAGLYSDAINTAGYGRTLATPVGGYDSDGDQLEDALELLIAESSAGDKDSDDDGLDDRVELYYKNFIGGSVAGTADPSAIPVWDDAMPNQADLFVEIDFMADTMHSDIPYATIDADLIGLFSNDQAFTGRAITTHVQVDQSLPHSLGLAYAPCTAPGVTGRADFYTFKNDPVFFNKNKPWTRYVVFGHQLFDPGSPTCATNGTSGLAEILGNDVIVTLGGVASTNNMQLGTAMHEVGHNLYLTHNGNDDAVAANRYGCSHSSVMNYRWQMNGVGNAIATRAFSYSRGQCLSNGAAGAQSGTGTCNATANTCTSGCVPNGQVTLKATCPPGPPGSGTFISNGTCDCDLDEWSAPPVNQVQVGRVSLQGTGSGQFLDGATTGTEKEEDAAFLLGAPVAQKARHREATARKKAKLVEAGLREGRDFIVAPNGKIYAH